MREHKGKSPSIHATCYVDPAATVIGDVVMGEGSSVWPGAVIRGDMNSIRIGRRTNIQDNSTLHNGPGNPLVVGDDVTIGHNCVVHGCHIEGRSIIGMGAIILNGARIGENCMIGAGAVVTEGKEIPPNSLVLGIPGRVVREVTDADAERIRKNAVDYVLLSRGYMQ